MRGVSIFVLTTSAVLTRSEVIAVCVQKVSIKLATESHHDFCFYFEVPPVRVDVIPSCLMDGFLLKTTRPSPWGQCSSGVMVQKFRPDHMVLGDWMVSPGLGPVLGDATVSSLVGLSKSLGISF